MSPSGAEIPVYASLPQLALWANDISPAVPAGLLILILVGGNFHE
jgi:hypothetical protein